MFWLSSYRKDGRKPARVQRIFTRIFLGLEGLSYNEESETFFTGVLRSAFTGVCKIMMDTYIM